MAGLWLLPPYRYKGGRGGEMDQWDEHTFGMQEALIFDSLYNVVSPYFWEWPPSIERITVPEHL